MADHPYTGLRPFLPDEADIFFGRDEQLDALIEKLGPSHFLTILGASGCGKSSLVHVGFLSVLHAGFHHGSHWNIALFRPGRAPFKQLTEALQRETQFYGRNLESRLRREGNLDQLLKESPLSPNYNLLILVDQFEELFRYDQQPGEIEEFITWLLRSSQHDNVYVVIAMRSEFSKKSSEYSSLAEALNRGTFYIAPLNPDQLRQAIEGPARVFEGKAEPQFVECLLQDLAQTEHDKLPLMQHTLVCMWPHGDKKVTLTLDKYKEVGGINALAYTAEEVFMQLNPEEQKIAEILLRNLTAYDDMTNQYVRNPITLSEVGELTGVTWQAVVPVIEAFRQRRRRFLRPMPEEQDRLQADTTIDISHEAFIRQWPRLGKPREGWAVDEQGLAKFYRRLVEAAFRYSEHQGELWHGRDLTNAKAWYQNVRQLYLHDKQMKAWANRRLKSGDQDHFNEAMKFLKSSQEAEEQRKKQEDEKRLLDSQRERDLENKQKIIELNKQTLKRTQQVAIAVIIGLILTTSFAVLFFSERNQFKLLEKTRTQDLFESRRTHAVFLAKEEDYTTAQHLLKSSLELDADIPKEHRHARNMLENLVGIMGGGTAEMSYGYHLGAPLYVIASSSKQKWLAVGGEKGTLVLLDDQNQKILQRFSGLTAYVRALVFDPQEQWMLSGDDHGQVLQWSLPNGTSKQLFTLQQEIWTLAISPDGKWLAAGGKGHDITLWSLTSKHSEPRILSGHEDNISALAFDAEGKRLLSGSYDKTVRLWQVEDGRLLHLFKGHTDKVQHVLFHPDGQQCVSSGNDKTIRFWNLESGEPVRVLNGHRNTVFSLNFLTPDLLASGSADKTVRIWDVKSEVTIRVLQGHTAPVTSLIGQGQQLFSASNDGSVRRWNIQPSDQIPVTGSATSVAIAPDGQSVVIGFAEGSLKGYALPDMKLLWEQPLVHQRDVQRLAFNETGQLLASASLDKTAKIWQVGGQSIQLLKTFKQHRDGLHSVTFSKDSQFLITASYDHSIGIVAVQGNEERLVEQAHGKSEVNSVVFDSTGQRLLSASDQDVRIWHFEKGQLTLMKSFPQEQEILWATWSPDDQWYVRTTRNLPVKVYNIAEGKELYDLPGHENSVVRAFFSPDGHQVITASADRTVRFWDLTQTENHELFTLHLPISSSEKSLYDFDFRCTPKKGCWLIIPSKEHIIKYRLGNLYEDNTIKIK